LKKLMRLLERIDEAAADNPHLVAFSIVVSSAFGVAFAFIMAYAFLLER